jgi:NitT/TauT family transport system permease protein
MSANLKSMYSKNEVTTWPIPNYWDFIGIVFVISFIIILTWHGKQMLVSYHFGEIINISLNPKNLPSYAVRTVLRMFIALFFSLLFTFIFGTLAAKNKRAERIIIPIIDVLQAVPILSFLSITIVGFIALFPGSILGPECAAIFLIFTSQVWNMTLSFYQSMRTVPNELREVADIFKLSRWQRFWRVEVPFAMPGLLWNMMMSMSGSWFFVISAEAISVADTSINLPGIGSYIALGIQQANNSAILYAILAMLLVIFLYDQLLFRPLVYWTERFGEQNDEDIRLPRSWLVGLFQHAKTLQLLGNWLVRMGNGFVNFSLLKRQYLSKTQKRLQWKNNFFATIYYILFAVIFIFALFIIMQFVFINVSFAEMRQVFKLGIFTGIRVMVLIIISSLIWIPIGVWIGLKPKVATMVQPIVQFLAAFPANLLFPLVAIVIVRYHLNVEIWVAPLMVLGTQWYILFNVIAGTTALPKDLKLVAANLRVKKFLWWRRLILPGIAPYYITGAITAAGGAWNASIVAEVIHWGAVQLNATGLGSYIAKYSVERDFPRIALGTIVMCIFVLIINRLIWRPLYNFAVERFQLYRS